MAAPVPVAVSGLRVPVAVGGEGVDRAQHVRGPLGVLVACLARALGHRPELQHVEDPPVTADPGRRVEDRTPHREPYCQRDDAEQGEEREERDRSTKVKRALAASTVRLQAGRSCAARL